MRTIEEDIAVFEFCLSLIRIGFTRKVPVVVEPLNTITMNILYSMGVEELVDSLVTLSHLELTVALDMMRMSRTSNYDNSQARP